LETRAERDAAADYPALHIRENWALEGASFQRPPGLRLRSLAVFDWPIHPHITCVDAFHRPAASVSLDDYWCSQSLEYFDEPTQR
jgi:hypothetical protein